MGEVDCKPLISVIVPVYKVEPYLHTCIDSILAQTYTNLEIILVDDGSPDNCPAICDEYAQKDARVKVIHKENGGLSDARNAGLDICTGEYLMFVDSDDLLTANAVESLYALAVKNCAQLVIGGYIRFENNPMLPNETNPPEIRIFSNTEAMGEMLRNGCASWARLYQTSVHKAKFFPKGEINEDEAVMLQVLEDCETAVMTNRVIYLYRCRPNSITTTTFSLKKLAWYRHCKANLEWIRAHHPELTALAAARYRGAVLWSLTEIALSNQPYKNEVKLLRSELCREKRLFEKIKFQYRTDYFRMLLLMYLPFGVYRILIRSKRRSL